MFFLQLITNILKTIQTVVNLHITVREECTNVHTPVRIVIISDEDNDENAPGC